MSAKYPGEKHAVLFTSSGVKRANYCGPGTNLEKRLRNGDRPVSNMDKICQTHDMAYAEVKSAADVRHADLVMLRTMDADPWIPPHEKLVIGNIMRSKMAGEDLGIISKGRYAPRINRPSTPRYHPQNYQNMSQRAQNRRKNLKLALLID